MNRDMCIQLVLCSISVASANVITISQGRLLGLRYEEYISFAGIPYATIEDDEHFKAATGPAPSWTGIREPRRSTCSITSSAMECLLLDVNMPYVTLQPLPVLVWVKGDGSDYHTGLLVKQGIIVVVVSHRYGIEGFLCSDDKRIPGNAGVKDVVLALRWVRDNIMEFSGNPARVVVGGQSFGAAMVEALTLSPMTDNLYNGIILQSGSILSPWAFQYDANERATILGRWYTGTGCDAISNLISASPSDLLQQAEKIKYPYHTFGICVEKDFQNGERFLTDSPINLLSHGKAHDVPMLVGYNNDKEFIFQTLLENVRAVKQISLSMPFLLPEELNFSSLDDRHVLVQMQKLYFPGNITIEALNDYYRDAYFLNHIHRSVRLHAAASALPIYYYEFSYPGEKRVEMAQRNSSASHLGEAYYLFPLDDKEYLGTDSKVQQDILTLWSNFIKYLEPTPKRCGSRSWRPVERMQLRLLDIAANSTMRAFPHAQQMEFWDAVYARYYYDKHTR